MSDRKLKPKKTVRRSPILSVIVGVGLLLTGFQASASIAEFRDEIVDVKKEVDATLAALDKDLIAKNKSEGLAIQQSLDNVITELNTVVAAITPANAKK